MGKSRSGICCTFMDLKDNKPATLSSTNNMAAGIGFRMDQAETFILNAPYLLAGCPGDTRA